MTTQNSTYIAIIDDDKSVCRALARLLGASGMHAIVYSSPEEFLEDHKRPAFDCLVADVRMAGLSGIDLQQRLVNSGNSPPTIFITADDDPATRERAERLGCVAYLRKTAPAQELLDVIRRVTARQGELTTIEKG